MANIIEKVNVGGTVYNIASTAYAVSSQAANEPAKTINIDGFALETGVTIHVKFANANTASNPTLTVSGNGSDGNSAVPIVGHTTWEAGAIFTLTYDGTNWVQDYDKIIENNITGSGTEGYLTKFNGSHSITNGPQLSSAISSQDTATKFLRQDGTWAAPSYIANTDEKVKQVGITTNSNYPILFKHATGTSDETDAVNFGKASNKIVTINPNTGAIAAPGGLTGNASSATAFSSAASVTLTGDVTGSASSTKGWSITTAIGEGKVTNAMLAGSIANGKLSNSKVTIAGQDVSLGGSIDAATLRTKLGLTQALRFVGSTSTTMSDGYTGTPAGISIYTGTGAVAPAVGDVVLDSSSNAEYVCISVSGTTYTWEILGAESSWALSNDVIHNAGAKGDILYWSDTNTPTHLAAGTNGHFLKLVDGVPTWAADNDTNTKVTQNILATSVADTYPLLVSYYKTTVNTTTAQTVNRVAAIYVQPSTGTLTATKLAASDGSGIQTLSATAIKTALNTGTSTSSIFLHKSGDWKTLKVTVTANNSGSVVTGVGFNQGAFPTLSGGTAATFEVTSAVLTITAGSNASLTGGTLPSLGTISKANLSVGYE